jgi:hypothetical protein
VLDISTEGESVSDALAFTIAASVSLRTAVSLPLHVSVLVTSVGSMKM